MVEESTPPLSQTPSGTSESRCSRTDCCSSESSSSLAESSVQLRGLVERQLPVSLGANLAVPPLEPVAGRELFDALDQRPGAGNVVQRKVAIQAGEAQAAVDFRMDENGLQLRAENRSSPWRAM